MKNKKIILFVLGILIIVVAGIIIYKNPFTNSNVGEQFIIKNLNIPKSYGLYRCQDQDNQGATVYTIKKLSKELVEGYTRDFYDLSGRRIARIDLSDVASMTLDNGEKTGCVLSIFEENGNEKKISCDGGIRYKCEEKPIYKNE